MWVVLRFDWLLVSWVGNEGKGKLGKCFSTDYYVTEFLAT